MGCAYPTAHPPRVTGCDHWEVLDVDPAVMHTTAYTKIHILWTHTYIYNIIHSSTVHVNMNMKIMNTTTVMMMMMTMMMMIWTWTWTWTWTWIWIWIWVWVWVWIWIWICCCARVDACTPAPVRLLTAPLSKSVQDSVMTILLVSSPRNVLVWNWSFTVSTACCNPETWYEDV